MLYLPFEDQGFFQKYFYSLSPEYSFTNETILEKTKRFKFSLTSLAFLAERYIKKKKKNEKLKQKSLTSDMLVRGSTILNFNSITKSSFWVIGVGPNFFGGTFFTETSKQT